VRSRRASVAARSDQADYRTFRGEVDAAAGETAPGICATLLVEVSELWRIDSVLGLTATDLLMGEAIGRMREALRDRDSVAQIGRYQVGCLLRELPSGEYATLAANKIVRTLSQPFLLDGRSFHLSAQVGIGLVDETCGSGNELLRRGAKALADAVARHQRVCVYDNSTDPLMLLQFDLRSDLKEAIENNELFMTYQPKLDIATGRLNGAEALLRWLHPKKGPIPPDRLVQVAEHTGLIMELTQWVLNTAMRQCAQYRGHGLDFGVSINLSAHNLREPDIVEVVSQALALWRTPGEQVVIELTETAVMDDEPQAQESLSGLKRLGIELSMDDFGTGYSSMARLRDLPLDELKIDRGFVRDILKAPAHDRIVQSMIGLAHSLDLRVVAEGVEERGILDRLRMLGCDCIQGYYIGKPMRIQEFIRFASDFPGLSPDATISGR